MQAEARLLVLTLGQPSRPGWPFSRKGGRPSQTMTGCDCHKRHQCLQLTAQGLRKLTRAREKQSWLEAAGRRAGRGVSGPGAGGGQLLLWKSQRSPVWLAQNARTGETLEKGAECGFCAPSSAAKTGATGRGSTSTHSGDSKGAVAP